MKSPGRIILLSHFGIIAATAQEPQAITGIEPTPDNIRRSRQNLSKAWSDFLTRPTTPPQVVGPEALKPFAVPFDLDEPGLPLVSSGDLYNPPVIASDPKTNELRATLTITMAGNRIGNDPVFLRSYNGSLVGPTLLARPGDTLRIALANDLDPQLSFSGTINTLNAYNTANLHTHGLQVSPTGVSDNVLLEVGPGSTQNHVIKIPEDHDAGTFWYHTHRHGSTAAQVGSGMSGALIIRGEMDEIPALKKTREQQHERVIVLQQIPYVYKHPAGSVSTDPIDLPEGVVDEQYSEFNFAPGSWDRMKRHVTINGLKLPIIRAKAGSLERWRIIDSALREPIDLSLRRIDKTGGSAPDTLDFHEIAVDGLCLGKIAKKQVINLWPGYRSDVLVQVPNQPGTRYLLRDERFIRPEHNPEERKAIAIIEVEGEAMASVEPLPTDAELAPFKRKDLTAPAEGTQPRWARYGIYDLTTAPRFTISDSPPITDDPAADLATFITFDHQKVANPAVLGATEDWMLTAQNEDDRLIDHPFHIHVNPFQILSAKKADGSHDDRYGELPMWRDTIILRAGTTLHVRTKYEKHPGLFVQHCHILDHEDQGMMKLVEIRETSSPQAKATLPAVTPYPAAPWKLRDLAGNERQSTEFAGRKLVLNFIEGYECLRCSEQLSELVTLHDSIRAAGLEVVVITPDPLEKLQASVKVTDFPFPILADPELVTYRAYGCAMGTPLHGTFLIDGTGKVRKQTVSAKPFMGLQSLASEGTGLSAK